MRVDDLLGGEDFLELPIVSAQAHPSRFSNEVTDPAVRPEPLPQLEGATQGAIVRGYALRREGEGACGRGGTTP